MKKNESSKEICKMEKPNFHRPTVKVIPDSISSHILTNVNVGTTTISIGVINESAVKQLSDALSTAWHLGFQDCTSNLNFDRFGDKKMNLVDVARKALDDLPDDELSRVILDIEEIRFKGGDLRYPSAAYELTERVRRSAGVHLTDEETRSVVFLEAPLCAALKWAEEKNGKERHIKRIAETN